MVTNDIENNYNEPLSLQVNFYKIITKFFMELAKT